MTSPKKALDWPRLSKAVRRAMYDQGALQVDITDQLCISRSNFSRFFNGRITMSADNLVAVCNHLDLDPREFLLTERKGEE